MVINEKDLLNLLDHSTKVALVEPQYKRKYIPLGLAKIGGYLEEKEVSFHRTYQANSEDLVCITSLFTYDVGKVIETISSAKFMNPMATIIVGGVMASLMPDYIEGLFPNIKIFTG